MAARAVGFLALSVESVSELVIQIVDIAGKVITPVTVEAELLVLVTGRAPVLIERCPLGVLVTPVGGVDIGQGLFALMA
jgi:hypothetical protein